MKCVKTEIEATSPSGIVKNLLIKSNIERVFTVTKRINSNRWADDSPVDFLKIKAF